MRSVMIGLVAFLALASGMVQAEDSRVARATFAAGIQDREPVAASDQFANELSPVFFFTEIVGADDKTITHRWSYKGEVKATISFDIKGPRWRVYSSKVMLPFWTGTWTVDVMDNDLVLGSWTFDYVGDY